MKKIILAFLMISILLCSCGTAENTKSPGTVLTTSPSTKELSKQATTVPLQKQEPSKVEKIILNSQVLKKDMNVNIYLPAGYNSAEKYPVLYLLHGYSGTQDSWINDLGVVENADKLIKEKKIKPLIIVSPLIDNSFGVNTSEVTQTLGGENRQTNAHKGMYEDYIIKELISYIDNNYSTLKSREGRYIGGLSMGGYAALYLSFKHTDMFSRVGGHSPALFLDDIEGSTKRLIYPDEATRKQRDPILMAQYMDLSNMDIYLDCGDKDGWRFYNGCEKLYNILKGKGVNIQYHLNPGAHDGNYWSSHAEEYLMFYAGQ